MKLNYQAGFLRGMGDVEISTCGLISVTIPTAIVTFISKAEHRTIRAHFAMAKVHSAAFRNSNYHIFAYRVIIPPEE